MIITIVSLMLLIKTQCQKLTSFNYKFYRMSQELLPYNVEKYLIDPILIQGNDDCYLAYDGAQYQLIQDLLHNRSLFRQEDEFQVIMQIQNLAEQTYYCSGNVFFIQSPYYIDLNITFQVPVNLFNQCNLTFYGVNTLILSNILSGCKYHDNIIDIQAQEIQLNNIKIIEPQQFIFDDECYSIKLSNIIITDVKFTFPLISVRMRQKSSLIIQNMILVKVTVLNTTLIDVYQEKEDSNVSKFQQFIQLEQIDIQQLDIRNSSIISVYGNILMIVQRFSITNSKLVQSPIFMINTSRRTSIDNLIIRSSEIVDQYLMIFNQLKLYNSKFYDLQLKKLSSLFHQRTFDLSNQEQQLVVLQNLFIFNIDLHHQSRIISITSEQNILTSLILQNINMKQLTTFGDYFTYLFIIYSQTVSIRQFTSLMNSGIISDFYIQCSFLDIKKMIIEGNNSKNQTVDSNNLNNFIENKQYRKQLFQIQSDQWVQIEQLIIKQIIFIDDQPIFIQLAKTSQDHIYLQDLDLVNNILIYTQIQEYYKSFIGLVSYSQSVSKLQKIKAINNTVYDKHGQKSRNYFIMIYSPSVYMHEIGLKFNSIINSGGSLVYIQSTDLLIQQCDLFLTQNIELIDYIIQLKDISNLKIEQLQLLYTKQIPIILHISDVHKISVMKNFIIYGNQKSQSAQFIIHKSKSPLSVILLENIKLSNLNLDQQSLIDIYQECQKCLLQIKDTIILNSFSKSQSMIKLSQLSNIGQIVIDKLHVQGTKQLGYQVDSCLVMDIISPKLIMSDIIVHKTMCNIMRVIQSSYFVIKKGTFSENQFSPDFPVISSNTTKQVQLYFENLKFTHNNYRSKNLIQSASLIYIELQQFSQLFLKKIVMSNNRIVELGNQDQIEIKTINSSCQIHLQDILILSNDCLNCINIQGPNQTKDLQYISIRNLKAIDNNSTNLIKAVNTKIALYDSVLQQTEPLKWMFYNDETIIVINQSEIVNIKNNIFYQIEKIQFGSNKIQLLDDSRLQVHQKDQIFKQLVISFDIGHNLNTNDRTIINRTIIDYSRYRDFIYFYLPSGQKLGEYKYQNQKHNYIQGLRVIAQNKLHQEILQLQLCNISTSSYSYINLNQFHIGSESQELDELILIMNPYQKLIETLIIECPQIQISEYNFMNYQLHIKIKTLPCQAGEYLHKNQCLICDSKLYYFTLTKHQTQCQLADNNIINEVRFNSISLRQNYWRPYQNSSKIERCELKSCIGGWNSGNQLCNTGKSGAICQECDLNNENGNGNFGRYIKGCYSCDNQNYIDGFLQLMCIMFLQIILMITSVQSNHKQYLQLQQFKWLSKQFMILHKLSVDQSGICIKMLIGHIQIIYLINNSYLYNFSFNLGIILITNPIKVTTFYFDCFLQRHVIIDRELYTELIIQFIHPLLILNIYILILLIFIRLQLIKYNISFITTAIIFQYFYNVLPLFQKLASLFTYKLLSGLAWVNSNYSYLFFSKAHLYKVYFQITPLSLFFAVIIPIVAIIYLTLIRNNMYNSKNYLIFGFIYRDYKQEAYLWEFVRLIYKLMLVSTIYFFINDQQYKFLIILLIIIGFSDINRRYQPYNLKNLNQYESDIHQYNNYCIIIIIFGQYFENQNEPFQYIIGMIYYAINIFLILKYGSLVIRLFIKQNYWATDKIKQFITEKFPKLGNKAILQQSQISRTRVQEQFRKIQSLYKIQSQTSLKLTLSKTSNGSNQNIQSNQNVNDVILSKVSIRVENLQYQTTLPTEENIMNRDKNIKSEIELMQIV